MNYIRKFLKKLTYRKKVFAGMILAAVIPLIICFGGVLLIFRGFNEKNLNDESELVLKNAGHRIEEVCDLVSDATRVIANAPATLRMLEDNDKTDVYNVYRMLYSSVTNVNRYADFAVYDDKGELKLYTGDRSLVKDSLSVNWGILYELKKTPEDIKVRGGRFYNGTNKNVVLRFGRAVVGEKGRAQGFVIAEIRESGFYDIFKGVISDNLGALYLLDDFNERIYESYEVEGDELSLAKSALILGDSDYFQPDNSYSRYYYQALGKYNLHMLYRQQTKPYTYMTDNLALIVIVASFAGLVISLIVSNRFSIMFYRPIKRMSEGMQTIKGGEFNVEIPIDSDDELGHLSKDFNEMSARLTDNMNELVKREQELADANIKMMQAQLNPHFIYNTLETMKWIGKDNEVPEVAVLSSGLADIMRASISSGQLVTLKKEVALVESYASIQQIRFSDKFEFLTDIPGELMDCEVPKLILQPIVENAILHGLSQRSYGQVLITGFREDNNLILIVKDDGVGVDDETMTKLNNHEQLAKGSNIGFHNVDSIIRLHYGEKYGINISRGCDGGTEVKYTLPFLKADRE